MIQIYIPSVILLIMLKIDQKYH